MVLKLEFKAESSGGLVKACITGPQAQMFWFSRSGRGPWKLHSDKISGEAEKPVGEPHFENLILRAQVSAEPVYSGGVKLQVYIIREDASLTFIREMANSI